jgi:hypothetical protein
MRLATHLPTASRCATILEKVASLIFVVIHGSWAILCSIAFLTFVITKEAYPEGNLNLALFALLLMSPSLLFLFLKEKEKPRPHGTWGETIVTGGILWTLTIFLKQFF